MALNICVEALIRLLFEIINFVFGDITLIFRGHPEAFWDVLQELLKTIVWIFIFFMIKTMIKNRFVARAIIVGVPTLLVFLANAVSGFVASLIGTPVLGAIVGFLFSSPLMIISGLLSALAWGFLAISDETVPMYLRFVGLPGMIVLGFVSGAIGPFGFLLSAGVIVGVSMAARIVIPLSTLIVLLVTFWSPTFFCETL
ncbi:MAG: hypothetical protein QXR60_03015, partial [Candidatus Nanoarchaeia archaeon]